MEQSVQASSTLDVRRLDADGRQVNHAFPKARVYTHYFLLAWVSPILALHIAWLRLWTLFPRRLQTFDVCRLSRYVKRTRSIAKEDV